MSKCCVVVCVQLCLLDTQVAQLMVLACIASKDEGCRFALGAGFGTTPSETFQIYPVKLGS